MWPSTTGNNRFWGPMRQAELQTGEGRWRRATELGHLGWTDPKWEINFFWVKPLRPGGCLTEQAALIHTTYINVRVSFSNVIVAPTSEPPPSTPVTLPEVRECVRTIAAYLSPKCSLGFRHIKEWAWDGFTLETWKSWVERTLEMEGIFVVIWFNH